MGKTKIDRECLRTLKKTVTTSFKNEKVKIILFGSRARGNNHQSSDVDIGIIPAGQFEETPITLLKEKIENLNIPYKVDMVNLSEVSGIPFMNHSILIKIKKAWRYVNWKK